MTNLSEARTYEQAKAEIRKENMKTARKIGMAVVGIASGIALAACTSSSTATKSQKAQNNISAAESTEFNKAVPYPFASQAPTDPLERKNLAARLLKQNSSGATAYVYLLAPLDGKAIGYYVIKGKVSSTSSEMTSTDINVNCGFAGNNDPCTNLAIGDDGSYGPSEGGEQGVFFFTSTGVLIETTLPWISSTGPIKIYSSVPQLDGPVG